MSKIKIFSCILSVFLLCSLPASAESNGAALYEAVLFQDLPKLESLLAQKGADANYKERGRPLLGWAAQSGNLQVVQALLKAGANPNITDEEGYKQSPLMRAIDTQYLEIVKALLASKADPNYTGSDGKSCLMMAAVSRKPAIVQALVDAGVDVKAVTTDGDSAVLVAAQDNMPESLEIIRILGKAGANMNASNAAYTPLVYAVQQGNKDLVKALLDAGADPNAKTNGGQTPVQYALDNVDVLNLLIQAKVDINTVNSYGTSLLIDAIQNNQIDAAKALISAGADLKLADSSGNTALQIAEQYSQSEIADLIRAKVGTDVAAENVAAESTAYPTYELKPAKEGECNIVDAARKQMEIHGLLQKQVDAGKMSDNIFRTFNEDTVDYARLLTEDPAEACRLLERLRIKYGV